MAEQAEAGFPDESELNSGLPFVDLLPALHRLDRLLERAIIAAEAAYGPTAASDPFRGLYIGRDQVERALARDPVTPVLQGAPAAQDNASATTVPAVVEQGLFASLGRWLRNDPEPAAPAPLGEPDAAAPAHPTKDAESLLPLTADLQSPVLAWLQHSFELSLFDLDVMLVALAPELDLRYERLYAYLQDDVTRKRPTVDLVLNLLCTDAAEKLERRVHLGADAPLIHADLIHLVPDPNQAHPPLLSHYVKLDGQITRLILGDASLDPRLVPFCRVVQPTAFLDELALPDEVTQTLLAVVTHAREAHHALRLHFQGPPGVGKRSAAEALAGEIGVPLLVVDIPRMREARVDFDATLKLVFRQAWFHNALVYLSDVDVLRCDDCTVAYEVLLERLAEDDGITILAGTQPWVPSGRHVLGVVTVSFPVPGFAQRRDFWQDELAALGLALEDADLDALAGRFRLTPTQIAEAVYVAGNQAFRRTSGSRPTLNALFNAARAQAGHELASLTRKIDPVYTWDDIVLPEDSLAQLREICQRVSHRHQVLGEWGFERRMSLGKGINALFAGPSGTGKTMAAEIVANELGLDLYRIDLSGVVSKYIGETEKNLDRIFQAAEDANAILFFDEADALFGKRSEVRDSHDRYANIEISYLLQKMEEYDGLAILATNLRQNLDDAFIRRLAFTIHFPYPDEESRRRIWAGIWPDPKLLAEDVNLDMLAQQFRFTGGNIRNVALASAFLAAEDDSQVTMEHLLRAVRREYQKMGKTLKVVNPRTHEPDWPACLEEDGKS